jgi:serine/threonine-protein kinase
VIDAIVDAHAAIAEQGFVAVDFYDGCLMYDFDSGDVQLVDLDLYTEGPYTLTAERQFGSTRFMAPEEFCRGAVIDQQTTVFTLGRTAMVLLGPDAHRRLGLELSDAVDRATQPRSSDRWPDVASFAAAWHQGRA